MLRFEFFFAAGQLKICKAMTLDLTVQSIITKVYKRHVDIIVSRSSAWTKLHVSPTQSKMTSEDMKLRPAAR